MNLFDTIVFDYFRDEIEIIDSYISYLEGRNELFHNDYLNSKYGKILNQKKRVYISHRKQIKEFEYKALIISIYGVLEQTIQKWFTELTITIPKVFDKYSELETHTRKVHLTNTIDLAKKLQKGPLDKFPKLDCEDLIYNLYKSIFDNDIKINYQSYLTSGNLNHTKIIQIFNEINFKIQDKGKDKYSRLVYLYGTAINTLVDRRNIIAHGGMILDYIDLAEIRELLHKLYLYCKNIFLFLSTTLRLHYVKKNYESIKITAKFKKNNVIELAKINNVLLAKGNLIYYIDEDEIIKSSSIENIVWYNNGCTVPKRRFTIRKETTVTLEVNIIPSSNNIFIRKASAL